jgi:hypothetical protein
VKCSDGMLYHEVVAEMALEGWLEKLTRRLSSGAGNAERWKIEFDPTPVRKEIAAAAFLLAGINAKSKWLTKQPVVMAMRDFRPDGISFPPGHGNDPGGIAREVNRREGKGLEDSDESSLSASASKVWPEGLIPDGFPDAQAISDAEAWVAEARAVLDAKAHAKRFRSHAKANGRELKSWPDGWRGWIDIELEKAPKAATVSASEAAPVFSGPAGLRDQIAAAMGDGWTATWFDQCKWRDVPTKALLVPLTFTADTITKAIGPLLDDEGVGVIVEPKNRSVA